MRELPILFSTAMVQAKLAGRKTQTRRIVKLDDFNQGLLSIYDDAPEILKAVFDTWAGADENGEITGEKHGPEWLFVDTDENEIVVNIGNCPYGTPGDLLWTREAFNYWGAKAVPHVYRATDLMSCGHTWKPSIHMPKVAARIWDEVTEIRIERLNEISEADAVSEGIEHLDTPAGDLPMYKNYLIAGGGFFSARQSFKSLFLAINGKVTAVKDKSGTITHYEAIAWNEADYKERFECYGNSWRNKPLKVTVNPWVWVISYKNLSTTGRPVEQEASHG